MLRSRLLTTLVWVAVLTSVPAGASQLEPDIDIHVSHGPVLGRLTPDSIGVWVRTSKPARFHVRYGSSADTLDSRSDTVSSRLEYDNTAWTTLPGLRPATRYYYQVIVEENGRYETPVFEFRTPPSADIRLGRHNPDGLFNFSFSATSCAKQSPTQGQRGFLHSLMLGDTADEVDFHVVLGDWLYEQDRRLDPATWLGRSAPQGTAMPGLLQAAPSLAGAWQNYKTYYENDWSLAEWHARVPSLFLFDDHELLNNFQDATVPGHTGRDALFRDPSLRAWQDYLGWSNPVAEVPGIRFGRAAIDAGTGTLHDPDASFDELKANEEQTLHVLWGNLDAGHRDTDANNRSALSAAIDSAGPADPNAMVYAIERVLDNHTLLLDPPPPRSGESAYSIGGAPYYFSKRLSNAELIGLDTRSRRRSSLNSDTPTMLGEEQKRWFLKRIEDSTASIIFVLSSVSFTIPHVSNTPKGIDDQSWTGYAAERAELFQVFEDSGKTVILVTGDLHNAFSVKFNDRLWEFSAGPIGSLNRAIGEPDGSGVPPNGPYVSAGIDTTIRWSTHYFKDTPKQARRTPIYAIIGVNNVFDNADADGSARWMAYPRPQVSIRFYDAGTGSLKYAESVLVEP